MVLRYGSPEEAGMSGKRIARLEALQQEWVDTGVSPVIVALVARKGIIVSHKLYLDKDYDKEYGPVKIDAIFPVASISKVVTATAVMQLVEEGRVTASLPVKDYIPEFDCEGKDKVLVHHLLTHTSGIDEEKIHDIIENGDFPIDMSKCPKNQLPKVYRYLEAGYRAPLRFLPGNEMSYCGYGFTVLSEIIRRVSGKNLDEFTRVNIFEPLKMRDSSFIIPDEKFSRVVQHPANAPFPNFSRHENLKTPWGGSGLSTTVNDMAIFCQMYLNGGIYDGKRILSRVSVEKMTTNRIPGISAFYNRQSFKEASWGLGWNISGNKNDDTGTLRSERTFSHTGIGNTHIMADPVNEVIAINFQITMKRINDRPYHRFEYFDDAALACIDD